MTEYGWYNDRDKRIGQIRYERMGFLQWKAYAEYAPYRLNPDGSWFEGYSRRFAFTKRGARRLLLRSWYS